MAAANPFDEETDWIALAYITGIVLCSSALFVIVLQYCKKRYGCRKFSLKALFPLLSFLILQGDARELAMEEFEREQREMPQPIEAIPGLRHANLQDHFNDLSSRIVNPIREIEDHPVTPEIEPPPHYVLAIELEKPQQDEKLPTYNQAMERNE